MTQRYVPHKLYFSHVLPLANRVQAGTPLHLSNSVLCRLLCSATPQFALQTVNKKYV